MVALDASLKDVCRVRRERTASPLQPLVLLNGPQFVEAARALADTAAIAAGDTDAAIPSATSNIFLRLTSREPTLKERDVLARLYEQELAQFTANEKDAQQYLAVGDYRPQSKLSPAKIAALAVVANTLLGFDECITKR
jgi:hypothetical protein